MEIRVSVGQPSGGYPDWTRDIRWAVQFMTTVFAVLAIYWAYVRYVVAKGH